MRDGASDTVVGCTFSPATAGVAGASSSEVSVPEALAGEEFVIGGGSVYRQFMPYADRLYITHVHRNSPADTWFPKIDMRKWRIFDKQECISGDDNMIPYTYVVYERKGRSQVTS